MTFRADEREERTAERIQQAHDAARTGDGWVELGAVWGMTSAGALMWCRNHVPAPVMQQIARNGINQRAKRAGRPRIGKTSTHAVFERHVYGGTVPTFTACIHVDGWTGQECGEPTQEGRQRCDACEEHRRTGLDRVIASPAQTEPVNWRAQGPTRDRRKTKAA